ncbi:MAG: DUF5602 domain-containing protein [Gemmatimonadaceae bacterium]
MNTTDRHTAHSPAGRVLTQLLLIGVLAGSAAALACSSDTTAPVAKEIDGPPVSVGNGTAQAFVTMRGARATAIGIAITDGAFSGLPADMAEYQLALPSGAGVTPFDHATLNWNPQGHPPPNIYSVPHFDFHFYTISVAAQEAVQGGLDTTAVPSQFVPQDYVSEVMAVPMMGVHWNDSLAAEWHGQPFAKTLIYGFNHGQLNFIEPMVTTAYLQQHPDVTESIKQPAAFQTPGTYPATYSIRYDAAHGLTRVTLDSLTTR